MNQSFTNVTHPHCEFWLPNSTESIFIEETRDPKFNSAVGQMINKFRKIELIDFSIFGKKVNEDVFKDLIKTKTKLSSLNIYYGEVDIVDPNIFIAACKKFHKINLLSIIPSKLLCDQVFVDLMANTGILLHCGGSANGTLDGYSLTDRTLKALTEPEVKYCFAIHRIYTSFTIAGIKTLVEEVIKAEDLNVVYRLGILKFSEERNAVRWMEEVAADPTCPYIIRRDDLVRGDDPYTINRKNDIRESYFRIDFIINRVPL